MHNYSARAPRGYIAVKKIPRDSIIAILCVSLQRVVEIFQIVDGLTSDLLLRVLLFGLSRTSLKSNFMSLIMFGIVAQGCEAELTKRDPDGP